MLTLEKLDGTLVLLGGGPGPEGAEVPSTAGSWVGIS
jgi:hypothetical protein